jgi:hypothetical protein
MRVDTIDILAESRIPASMTDLSLSPSCRFLALSLSLSLSVFESFFFSFSSLLLFDLS